LLESGNDATGGYLSRLQAEALAQAHAHGGRNLHNNRVFGSASKFQT